MQWRRFSTQVRKTDLMTSLRVVRTVARIEPRSALRLSLLGGFTVYLVVMVAGISLWGIATVFGVIDNVEDFFGGLISSKDFEFLSIPMFIGSALTGIALVILGAVVSVILTAVYNLVAEVVGGLEVASIEEDASTTVGPTFGPKI